MRIAHAAVLLALASALGEVHGVLLERFPLAFRIL